MHSIATSNTSLNGLCIYSVKDRKWPITAVLWEENEELGVLGKEVLMLCHDDIYPHSLKQCQCSGDMCCVVEVSHQ